MSHKIAAPPIAPFAGGRTVIVDKSSSSLIEDGTWANPYKTIQAALDAAPAYDGVHFETHFWLILVAAGIYDEALVIPTTGGIGISALDPSEVYLGDPAGPLRDITWNPISFPGAVHAFALMGCYLHGYILLDSPSGVVSPTITVQNVTAPASRIRLAGGGSLGNAAGTGVNCIGSRFDRVQLNCHTRITGGIFGQVEVASLEATSATFSGHITLSNGAMLGNSLKDCTTADVWCNGTFSLIQNTTIHGLLVTTTILGTTVVRQVIVDGTASLGGTRAIQDSRFGSGIELLGNVSPRMTNTVVVGSMVCPGAPFNMAEACWFQGGITLTAVPLHGFFSCRIDTSFGGPPGSYKVDPTTNSLSNPGLLYGATPDLLKHGSAHVGAADPIANMVGDAGTGGVHGLAPAPAAGKGAAGACLKADGTWTVPAVAGLSIQSTWFETGLIDESTYATFPVAHGTNRDFLLGVYIRRVAAGMPPVGVDIPVSLAAYRDGTFTDPTPVYIVGSPYMGVPIPGSGQLSLGGWLYGPVDTAGQKEGLVMYDYTSEAFPANKNWYFKFWNQAYGGGLTNQGNFRVLLAWLDLSGLDLTYP